MTTKPKTTGEQARKPREQCESCGSDNTQRSATKYVEAGVLEFRMCYDCGSGYTIGYTQEAEK